MALWADELVKVHTMLGAPGGVRETISRPIPGPFWSRVKDAWLVIRAKAEAVQFLEHGGWPPMVRPAPPAPPPPPPPAIRDPGVGWRG